MWQRQNAADLEDRLYLGGEAEQINFSRHLINSVLRFNF